MVILMPTFFYVLCNIQFQLLLPLLTLHQLILQLLLPCQNVIYTLRKQGFAYFFRSLWEVLTSRPIQWAAIIPINSRPTDPTWRRRNSNISLVPCRLASFTGLCPALQYSLTWAMAWDCTASNTKLGEGLGIQISLVPCRLILSFCARERTLIRG